MLIIWKKVKLLTCTLVIACLVCQNDEKTADDVLKDHELNEETRDI